MGSGGGDSAAYQYMFYVLLSVNIVMGAWFALKWYYVKKYEGRMATEAPDLAPTPSQPRRRDATPPTRPPDGAPLNYANWKGGLPDRDRAAIERHRKDAFSLLDALGLGKGKGSSVFPALPPVAAPTSPLPPVDIEAPAPVSPLAPIAPIAPPPQQQQKETHDARPLPPPNGAYGLDVEAGVLGPRRDAEYGLDADVGAISRDADGYGLDAQVAPAPRRVSFGGATVAEVPPRGAAPGGGLASLAAPREDAPSPPPSPPRSPERRTPTGGAAGAAPLGRAAGAGGGAPRAGGRGLASLGTVPY